MGIWARKPNTEHGNKIDPSEKITGGQGSGWTNGRQLGAKLTTVLLFTAIVCGPAGLVVALASSSKPAAIAETATQAGLTAEQQTAGSYALGYVGAWLGASRDDPGPLSDYIDLSSATAMSDVPWEYRDLAVASIIAPAGQTLVTVIVAGSVKEQGITQDGDATTMIWPRRYYQVVVRLDGSATRVIGMPTPVAGPDTAEPAILDYPLTVASSEPAAETTLAFLGAYLANSGDISRYITPGTALEAIKPAPYVQLTPTDIRVNQQPTSAPADGETVKVLATVTLANASDQRLSASYALTLTARANRWEVSSIDLAPQEAASTETGKTTSPPTPTGADTTKGN